MTTLLQPPARAPRGGDASVPAAPDGAPAHYAEHPWHDGYHVGTDGSVWRGHPALGGRRLPATVAGGHPRVCLGSPKKTTRPVRLLVLEAHVGPRPYGTFPCHADGDTLDCRLENLSWVERLPGDGQLADLDQLAAIVKRREADLLPMLGEMPAPAVLGVLGKSSLWDWPSVRPWLERAFACRLPERFPTW